MTVRTTTFLAVAALAAVPATAGAATPRVLAQVVGGDELVAGWRITTPGAFTARIAPTRCAVPAATPLAALEQVRRQTGPQYTLAGSCAKPSVRAIGNERGTSASPWVYKVGRVRGTRAATQRLRKNDRVLWFRCARTPSGCRRTLELSPATASAPSGRRVTFTVRGYDDQGRGRPVAGATLSLSGSEVKTDRSGRAAVVVPSPRGPYPLFATAPGMADAFPATVTAR